MNMVIGATRLDITPVPFISPLTKAFDVMPLEMVQAYVPYASYLNLEEAAKVAAIRDFESAAEILRDLNGGIDPIVSCPITDGCGHDELSVEAPSLR